MNAFFKYLAFILIVGITSMVLLDMVYTFLYERSKPLNKVQSLLKLSDSHFDIAFYGSSRTENHINCELITKITGKSCINLGFSGASLGDILLLSRINRRNNITFDSLFVQLDYNYNQLGLTSYFKANIARYQKGFLKEWRNSQYSFDRRIPFYRFMKYEKVLGFRELLVSNLKSETKKNIQIGYQPKFGIGKQVAGNFPKDLISKNSELIGFEKVNKDVTKIYFTAPYCKKLINRDKIKRLSEKVGIYKNYAEIYDDNPEYFFNCGHLNNRGANAFTMRIISDFNL